MQGAASHDVLIVGGGNAALCAALSARLAGATVLLLEAAPRALRGGNSRHTRNLRLMDEAAYPFPEYWNDLMRVTEGRTNESLARITLEGSARCGEWMRRHGVRFQPALGGTLHLSRTNAFFLGGGKALLNAYYRAAERLGVAIEYDAEVRELVVENGRFVAASVVRGGAHADAETEAGRTVEVRARSLVAASGGFQGNLEWLREVWGDAVDNIIIRGTPYDRGTVLRALEAAGARMVGSPDQCHAVAVDARSPRFDGGIVTRVDCVSLGIVVNRDARRFYDEGEDFWPKRYAIWGRLIAEERDQIAYAIIDSQSMGMFLPPLYPPMVANSVRELAPHLSLAPAALERTVAAFNAAVRPGSFDHSVLDDCRTEGLFPPKSHWARRLERPPYYAYPLRPGITFTYRGVGVNEHARVLMDNGEPAENICAAGEIMAGNILGQGYLAGLGMTIGTVFGRIAGEEAARLARG